MAGDFAKRIQKLREDTPDRLTGEVIRDQPYAEYQHEHLELNHPNGGQAKYQEAALLANYPEYLEMVAKRLLEGKTVDGMEKAMVLLGEDSGELTPKDLEVLANSDAKRVLADGEEVRFIPALAPRIDGADRLGQERAGVRGRYAEQTGPNRKPPAGAKVYKKARPTD